MNQPVTSTTACVPEVERERQAGGRQRGQVQVGNGLATVFVGHRGDTGLSGERSPGGEVTGRTGLGDGDVGDDGAGIGTSHAGGGGGDGATGPDLCGLAVCRGDGSEWSGRTSRS